MQGIETAIDSLIACHDEDSAIAGARELVEAVADHLEATEPYATVAIGRLREVANDLGDLPSELDEARA